MNKTYEALLRDAHRKEALEERREQQKSPLPGSKSTSPHKQRSPTPQTPEFDGSHVQTDHFAADLLQRVGIGDDEQEDVDSLLQSPTNRDRDRDDAALSTAPTTPYSLTPPRSTARNDSIPQQQQQQQRLDLGASPSTLRRNHKLVEVLNDVQQVSLCFQEIIKHISFHRVNTGRVLWKLQATYVQLFERLIKVFSQRAKQEQEQLKQDGGMKTEELDMLRLQIMDRQAKLDAAQKTTHTYKDTIKEQNAHITVLQNEITTLRSAIVDEAAAADEAAQRREADEEEIRHKIQLDVRDRSDARRALFGGAEPSELDSAFTDSLGTMFEAIEDADHQLGSQESLLNNMNSLMDVQQVSLLLLLLWWWSSSFQREIAGAVCVVLLVLCCCCFFLIG